MLSLNLCHNYTLSALIIFLFIHFLIRRCRGAANDDRIDKFADATGGETETDGDGKTEDGHAVEQTETEGQQTGFHSGTASCR